MLSAFLLVFLAEMGDNKIQLAVLALESSSIVCTLAGALAAFALAVLLRERLSRAFPERLVSLASSVVFLIALTVAGAG